MIVKHLGSVREKRYINLFIIIIIICRLDKDHDQELAEMLSIQLFRIASGQRSVWI